MHVSPPVFPFRGICFRLLFHSILWSIIIPCFMGRVAA
jgi:hypothetical protein